MVLEALSQEFKTECPLELLYAYHLAIIAESIEELYRNLTSWKVNLENKRLRVDVKKTKVMFSGQNTKYLEIFMNY